MSLSDDLKIARGLQLEELLSITRLERWNETQSARDANLRMDKLVLAQEILQGLNDKEEDPGMLRDIGAELSIHQFDADLAGRLQSLLEKIQSALERRINAKDLRRSLHVELASLPQDIMAEYRISWEDVTDSNKALFQQCAEHLQSLSDDLDDPFCVSSMKQQEEYRTEGASRGAEESLKRELFVRSQSILSDLQEVACLQSSEAGLKLCEEKKDLICAAFAEMMGEWEEEYLPELRGQMVNFIEWLAVGAADAEMYLGLHRQLEGDTEAWVSLEADEAVISPKEIAASILEVLNNLEISSEDKASILFPKIEYAMAHLPDWIASLLQEVSKGEEETKRALDLEDPCDVVRWLLRDVEKLKSALQ